LFYKLSGKKMAEIQARLEVKRAKDAAKLDENGNPVAAPETVAAVEDAGLAVEIEATTNDITTPVESQIIAEATQELVNDEEKTTEDKE